MRLVQVVVGVALLVVSLVGCAKSAPQAASAVVVDDAFTTEGTMAVAVYLDLSNSGGADTIVGAELAGQHEALAKEVTLHQTSDRDGLSIMEPTDGIEIAGDTDDALAPDGAHLMLEDLSRPIVAGEVIPLRLDLKRGADIELEAHALSADEAVGRLTGDES